MDTLTIFLILLTATGVASGILEWRKLKKKGQESYKNKEYSTATVHQENSSDQGDNASDSGGGGHKQFLPLHQEPPEDLLILEKRCFTATEMSVNHVFQNKLEPTRTSKYLYTKLSTSQVSKATTTFAVLAYRSESSGYHRKIA